MNLKYDNTLDSELYMLICEENEDAKDIIYEKYKYIIDITIRKYALTGLKNGFEYQDLYQEALVGFSDALCRYQEEKNTSLATFITLCVDRHLQNVLRKASRIKNRVVLESLSLDHVYEEYDVPLKDFISDNSKHDPLNTISKEEEFDKLLADIQDSLAPNEKEVYDLLILGKSYQEIAKSLNKTPKQIDNTIQRLKTKIKDILLLREID